MLFVIGVEFARLVLNAAASQSIHVLWLCLFVGFVRMQWQTFSAAHPFFAQWCLRGDLW